MPKITILVVEPSKKPYVKEIENNLKSLQHEVDGCIQAVYPWKEPVALICDEESKLKNKSFNRALRDDGGKIYDYISGTFIITGLGEEDFASLLPELVTHFSDLFSVPEMLVSIDGQLTVLPC